MPHKYIDTHSPLNLMQFEDDREEVMAGMREADVGTITVGVDFLTSRKAVELAQTYPDVILGATVGVHPTDSEEDFVPEHYAGLFATHESPGQKRVVVAIGECGFDYFRTPREEVHERQREIFEKQIAFAVEHDLPLMLHVRPSKGSDDAHDDALALLEKAKQEHGAKVRGTAHFFTGSLESAKRYWTLGFATSFPGVITFAKETEAVVREAPAELMLSETDAPYAAPVPYRGERCEPTHVVEVVKKIAEIRGGGEETMATQLRENARHIFGV